jgi:hypothetical protein
LSAGHTLVGVGVGVVVAVCVRVGVSVAVSVGVGVVVAVSVGVGVSVAVCVGLGVVVAVCVGVGVFVAVCGGVGVVVAVCVGVGVFVAVCEGVGVIVAVYVSVAVCVGVGDSTISVALLLVAAALVANALTVFVKVSGAGGVAVVFTVIVAEAPRPKVGMRTSKFEVVNDVTKPAVVVTLFTIIHDGKSLSLTTTPRAPKVPLLVTTIVNVTLLLCAMLIVVGLTALVSVSEVDGVNGQLRESLL